MRHKKEETQDKEATHEQGVPMTHNDEHRMMMEKVPASPCMNGNGAGIDHK